jgi:competence protein ComEA
MWHTLDRNAKIGLATLVAASVGAAGYVGVRNLGSTADSATAGISAVPFAVHVAGAVERPQVIEANATMLVNEAIRMCGGPTTDADLNQINLAAKLQPNTQLYVPFEGEDARDRLGPYAAGARAPGSAPSPSGPGAMININTADEAELDKLPGVGPATAKAIIEYRSRVGQFKSVDELLNVKGIGPKKLEQIRPYVVVN